MYENDAAAESEDRFHKQILDSVCFRRQKAAINRRFNECGCVYGMAAQTGSVENGR